MPTPENEDDTVDLPASGNGETGGQIPHIDGYDVHSLFAHNPIGIRIYKARHLPSDSTVSLKVLPSVGDLLERPWKLMQREAEILGSLDHPGIVRLIECSVRNGFRFLACEYVNGRNLREQMHHGLLRPRDVAGLVAQIAQAVHYAHQRGIIHGDLNPLCIELTQEGSPKIVDFHLARRLPVCADNEFAEGSIVGRPAYMAPEQVRGITSEIGTAVDVYGLGGILHALLTSRPPNEGKSGPELVESLVARGPETPRSFSSDIPIDLQAITRKCLRKDPAERYSSAVDLADDLRRFSNGEAVTARPLGPIGQFFRWLKR